MPAGIADSSEVGTRVLGDQRDQPLTMVMKLNFIVGRVKRYV
jgi:hypothetical protein